MTNSGKGIKPTSPGTQNGPKPRTKGKPSPTLPTGKSLPNKQAGKVAPPNGAVK